MSNLNQAQRYEAAWWWLFNHESKLLQKSIILEPESRHNTNFIHAVIDMAEDEDVKNVKLLQERYDLMLESVKTGKTFREVVDKAPKIK